MQGWFNISKLGNIIENIKEPGPKNCTIISTEAKK
jgi:hypothetical protein